MNQRRTMLLVFLACLALGTFRSEWKYGIPETSFFMRVAVAVVPVAIVLICGFAVGAFRVPGNTLRFWLGVMGLVLFGTVQLAHAFVITEFRASLRPDFYLSVTLTIAGAMIGYWFAADPRDLHWALKRIAAFLALLSIYAGLARLAGAGDFYPLLVPGFPIRLFILFAYCWYLYHWLNRSRWSIGPLLGLAACSPEILITFHKPILFCTLVASTFVFFYSIWATGRVSSILARTVTLAVIGTSVLVAVDFSTGGRIVSHLEEQVRVRILHRPGSPKKQSFAEAVERAAGNRFTLWREGLSRFEASPLIGSGFGQQMRTGLQPDAERYAPETTYVHNGYLDLLISVGLLGSLPVAVALIWWLRVAFGRNLTRRMAHLVVPCLAFVVVIMAFNLGGGSRIFFSLNAFTIFFMAVIVRLADDVSATAPLRNRRYDSVRRVPWQGRIRYGHGRC